MARGKGGCTRNEIQNGLRCRKEETRDHLHIVVITELMKEDQCTGMLGGSTIKGGQRQV